MAEVLGLVTSGAGIMSPAGQIVGIVSGLKKICSKIKNAGEDIRYLIEEVQTISLVLNEIGDCNYLEGDSPLPVAPVQKSLELCRRSAEILSEIAVDLDEQISKQRLKGVFRAALKEEAINKLRERLRFAQVLLMISYHIYSEALQRRRHELYVELRGELGEVKYLLAASTGVELQPAQAPNSITHDRQQKSFHVPKDNLNPEMSLNPQRGSKVRATESSCVSKTKRRRHFAAQFRPPSWFTYASRAWELFGYRTDFGWMFTLRTYNIVPSESPILQHVQRGDVEEIQRLFGERKASPFDRDPNDFTLLDVAAKYHQLDVCRLLIDHGANPNVSAYDSVLQAPCIPNVFEKSAKARTNKDFFELVCILTKGTDYEVFAQENSFTGQGPYEVITWLVQQYHGECGCPTTERRASIIEACVARLAFLPNMASLIRIKLGGKMLKDMLGPETLEGRFLLHCAAQNLAEHCAFLPPQHNCDSPTTLVDPTWINANADRWNDDERRELFSLISELVGSGFDLHRLNFFGRSPLLALFAWFIQWPDPGCPGDGRCREFSAHQNEAHIKNIAANFLAPARVWLEQLSGAGVDLLQYGDREKRLNFHGSSEADNEYLYSWRRKGGKTTEDTMKPRLGIFDEVTEDIMKLRLSTFTYGPSPCDWQFWVTEVLDESFAEFWDMVDHPERAMPGAWNC